MVETIVDEQQQWMDIMRRAITTTITTTLHFTEEVLPL